MSKKPETTIGKSSRPDDEAIRLVIEKVSQVCGLSAGESKLVSAHPLTTRHIASLSRTSPEMQRHVIGRLLAGEADPFRRIAATLLVYDTVAFGEVLSRLNRAKGAVRHEVAYIIAKSRTGAVPDRTVDRVLTLDLIVERAETLHGLLSDLDVMGTRNGEDRESSQVSATPDVVEGKLHAPAALGLLSKNAHDVAELRVDHLPSPSEKMFALTLCNDIRMQAAAGREAVRREHRYIDRAGRVRGRTRPSKRVITHAEPDGDAIVSAWLAERWLVPGESVEILFVERSRALAAYRPGDVLVDVGNTHDPANGFFDHKPPAFPNRHASCAAMLVWEHLLLRLKCPVNHLQRLVRAVFAGDSPRHRVKFGSEYQWSRRRGLHAVLEHAKQHETTDAAVYRRVRRWLDGQFGTGEK